MDITEEQSNAETEVVELIADKVGVNRQIHPATAISAGARLAGSFLFRSFNFNYNDIKPGTAVLSEEANEKGPVLINVLGFTLTSFGLNLDPDMLRKASKAESNISFIQTLNILQDGAHEIMELNKLSHEQMAYSCAMATAFIIKECQADLPAESGFNTAVYAFIEGSKTCPTCISRQFPQKEEFLEILEVM